MIKKLSKIKTDHQILYQVSILCHAIECRSFVCQQILWRVKFFNCPFVQHHDPVVVHDCVQPVSNGEDGAGGEGVLDGALDGVVRLHIYRRRRLVQQENLVPECELQ